MPGTLRRDARCWKCDHPVVAVARHWSPRNERASLEFIHANGKKCAVRTTFKKSERAMVGLPRK